MQQGILVFFVFCCYLLAEMVVVVRILLLVGDGPDGDDDGGGGDDGKEVELIIGEEDEEDDFLEIPEAVNAGYAAIAIANIALRNVLPANHVCGIKYSEKEKLIHKSIRYYDMQQVN